MKMRKNILLLLIVLVLLSFSYFLTSGFKRLPFGIISPFSVTKNDPEPELPFGQITRNDAIKHIEWAYRNYRPYEQVALEEGWPKDYVVTSYQPNFRGDASDSGGVMVFQIKNNQPKVIWESTEDITLTMPEVLDVRDITGDKKVEIISTWSDGKVSILYLYSWDGKTFKYITPLIKSESKYAPPNSYSPIFGTNGGDIQVKDLDGDNIDEVIISGGTTRDEIGNELPIESETIYKWDTSKKEYYLWKEEKI